MELKQELKLKQTLSQKMIQSANILQMGQIELKEYIEEMALENPVVDLEEREPENGRLEENGELNEKIRRFEELASLDRQNQTYYQDEEEEAGRLEPGRSQDGLLESLLEQACMLHLTKREEKIFRYMIKNLDASGYLSVNFGELCAGLGIEETEGERIWKNFGRLEPCGIGARSLKECLLMQLSYLAEEILCVQGEFFAKGSGKLAPWTQKQAAKSLGVSEPTLSRTVREKYLQCRWGIFPLSYFFSRHMAAGGFGMTDKGRLADREEAANQEETAVQAEVVNRMETGKDPREAIRHLIKTENPRKPFSDRVLSEKLAEAGITLSRRTVAKYREEMGIRDASGRKCFGI